jgi:hypothetical protein
MTSSITPTTIKLKNFRKNLEGYRIINIIILNPQKKIIVKKTTFHTTIKLSKRNIISLILMSYLPKPFAMSSKTSFLKWMIILSSIFY